MEASPTAHKRCKCHARTIAATVPVKGEKLGNRLSQLSRRGYNFVLRLNLKEWANGPTHLRPPV